MRFYLLRIRHKFIREHSQLRPEDIDKEDTESVATTTLSSVFPQPEKHWSTELSKYLWRNCNPGYILKTQKVPSTTKEHFSYDEEEVCIYLSTSYPALSLSPSLSSFCHWILNEFVCLFVFPSSLVYLSTYLTF